MKKYKAVFFDLDHTLWDFDKNSEEAIRELYERTGLTERGVPGFEEFISRYKKINRRMWDAYHRHEISKEELRSGRFLKSLQQFGINDPEIAETLASEYVRISPYKTNLFPGAIEVLSYLKQKYSLHIITNGFREVQHIKIRESGLKEFFSHIHISEEVGFKKPEPEIFHLAVSTARATHAECIMIGDNFETDITGAQKAGIDCIYFSPELPAASVAKLPVISHLNELKRLL